MLPPTVTFTQDNLQVHAEHTNLSFDLDPLGSTNVGDYLLNEAINHEGQPINASLVNGVDPANLTLSVATDVNVTFVSEGAGYHNIAGVYTFDDNGNIEDGSLKFIWLDASSVYNAGPPLQNFPVSGPDIPQSTTVDLGNYNAGSKLGFFLIANGANQSTGFYNQIQGIINTYNANNPGSPITNYEQLLAVVNAQAITINGDNEITLNGNTLNGEGTYFSHDPNMNPDNLEHSLSGPATSDPNHLYVGFEDLLTGGDMDYNDIVFKVDIGEQNLNALTGTELPFANLDVHISDLDSTQLAAVLITTDGFHAGDVLNTPNSNDLNITTTQNGDNYHVLIQNIQDINSYEDYINSIFYTSPDDPVEGVRSIHIQAMDAQGNVSTLADTHFEVVTDDILSVSKIQDEHGFDNGPFDLGKGDDTVYTDNPLHNDQHLNGNEGFDTLKVGRVDGDITQNDINNIQNFEQLDMRDFGENSVTLNYNDVINATDENNALRVLGDTGQGGSPTDSVNLNGQNGQDWVNTGTTNANVDGHQVTFDVYQLTVNSTTATVQIQQQVNVSGDVAA